MNIANRYTAKTIDTLLEIKRGGEFNELAKQLVETPLPKIKPFQAYTEIELAPKIQEKLAQQKELISIPYLPEELNKRIASKLTAYQAKKAKTTSIPLIFALIKNYKKAVQKHRAFFPQLQNFQTKQQLPHEVVLNI